MSKFLSVGILGSLVVGAVFSNPTYSANPSIKSVWNYYDIEGTTSKELKKQMQRRGPDGYWAYSVWELRWTDTCEVDVVVDYMMPRWKNQKSGSANLQTRWQKMLVNLKMHEMVHGSHGIRAAKEIVATNCENGNKILRKWARQDKLFDKKTNHGEKTGVLLP